MPSLHLIDDAAGQRMSVGELQAKTLLLRNLIDRVEFIETGPLSGITRYRIVGSLSVAELNAEMLGDPTMRECDYCQAPAPGWVVTMRGPFDMHIGVMVGPFTRDVYCCDTCAAAVEANAKATLIDRMIDAATERLIADSPAGAAHIGQLGPERIREGLAPDLRAFVDSTLAHRKGRPERVG